MKTKHILPDEPKVQITAPEKVGEYVIAALTEDGNTLCQYAYTCKGIKVFRVIHNYPTYKAETYIVQDKLGEAHDCKDYKSAVETLYKLMGTPLTPYELIQLDNTKAINFAAPLIEIKKQK